MKLEHIITENFQTVSINGILYSLNTDEKAIYDKIKNNENKKLFKKDLDEFNQRIASGLVTKGILQRRKNPQHEIYFTTRGRRKNAVYNRPLDEVAPPDTASEKWINKNKDKFKEKYGKDYKKYLYGKAWNMYNGSTIKETYELQAILDRYTLMEATTAYHGSPYDFDEFNVKFIGKGEGHQVHGWGLYFAEDMNTSNSYYRDMGKIDAIKSFTLNGKSYAKGTVMYKILSLISQTGKKKYAVDKLNEILNNKEWIDAHPDYKTKIKDLIKFIRGIKQNDLKANISMKTGQLFTVELPDKQYYLDEDLPFDKQSPNVQKAITNIYKSNSKFDFSYLKKSSYTGDQIYKYMSNVLGGDKNASLALYNEKVPGIRYDGYRDNFCFVIFNGKDVKIVNKEINISDNLLLPEKEMIDDDPFLIANIDNPSEELQLYALNRNFSVFKYIKNPTEKVIEKALELYSNNLVYVQNPTSEQISFAIKDNYDLAVDIAPKLTKDQIFNIIKDDDTYFPLFYNKVPEIFDLQFFKKCLNQINSFSYNLSEQIFPLEYFELIIDKLFDKDINNNFSYMVKFVEKNIDNNNIDINNLSDKLRYIYIYTNYKNITTFKEIKDQDVQAIIDYINNNGSIYDYIVLNENQAKSLSISIVNKLLKLVKVLKTDASKLKANLFVPYLNMKQIVAFTEAYFYYFPSFVYQLSHNDETKYIEYLNEFFTYIYNKDKKIVKQFCISNSQCREIIKNNILPIKDKLDADALQNFMSIIISLITTVASKTRKELISQLGELSYPLQKQLVNQNIIYSLDIPNLDKRIQMKLIEKNPFNIKYINNPLPEIVKLAYEKNPETKNYIR